MTLQGHFEALGGSARHQALVDGLSAGLANPRGWMRNVLDGTGRIARNLNVEPEHGFVEVRRTDGRDNEEGAPDVLYAYRTVAAPS